MQAGSDDVCKKFGFESVLSSVSPQHYTHFTMNTMAQFSFAFTAFSEISLFGELDPGRRPYYVVNSCGPVMYVCISNISIVLILV